MLSGRWRRAAGALVAVSALTVVGGAPAARAAPAAADDSVRSAEMWVLNDINVRPAWNITRGHGVTVAVIDSGVDGQVSDLDHSVINGPDYTGVHTSPSNPNWGVHGTWMASLIAGHGNGPGDADGVIGVAPQSRVLSVRVITDKHDPGYAAYERQSPRRGQAELARAIRYAVGRGAEVISMSLGYGAPSHSVRAALQYAYDHRVVVVASSGNSGTEAEARGKGSAPYSFPASYPGVLGVAAVAQDGQPASFSSDNVSVQVAAPGVNVPAQGRDGGYWLVSGTSPACALTAGVAALIKSRYPGLSDAQVSDAITSSAWKRPRGGPDEQVGFGTVNAAAALRAARRVARQTRTATRTVAASSHFGGGLAAIPGPPVAPRGSAGLALFCLLGAACLAMIGFAAVRLVAARPLAVQAEKRGPLPPTPGWGLLPAPGEQDEGATDPGRRPGADESDGAGEVGGSGGYRGADEQSGFVRFPWQAPSAGRHAAPSDRSGGPGPGGRS
jgi:type VII secretion-associated serine protease mycosin